MSRQANIGIGLYQKHFLSESVDLCLFWKLIDILCLIMK